MADPLLEVLAGVGLKANRSAEYVKVYCPFHRSTSGKTLWIAHTTGRWGCFSTRCPQHGGGDLQRLLTLRGMPAEVAASVVRGLDLSTQEATERPQSLADHDNAGRIREAHVAHWLPDWNLALEVCEAAQASSEAYVQGAPLHTWARGCPAGPGEVEHDFWEYFWYLLKTRGLTPYALDLMEVGLDRERGLLVFPVRDPEGRLLGVARRECRDGADYVLDGCVWRYGEPEYTFIKVERGETFFGWSAMRDRIMRGDPVIVVEGYADQLRLAGYGLCTVAKLGRQMSVAQARLLATAPGRKVVWTDDDREGLKGGMSDARSLVSVPGSALVTEFFGVNDAGDKDMTAQVAARTISSAVHPIEWLARVPGMLARHTA